MEVRDAVVVVTGGASGIGRALARCFAAEGARGVVVSDLDGAGAMQVAEEIGGVAITTDVAREADVVAAVDLAEERFGPVDLYCSNAGISVFGGVEVADADWQRILDVNVLAHVYAARRLLPGWIARGHGHLLVTASAAGLLTQLGSAPYAVSKHAAVALAEWLAITHGDQGVGVSVLCPQGVRTAMTAPLGDDGNVVGVDGMLDPDDVATATIEALATDRFLVLPHPEVAEYLRRKGDDPERWLAGMRRLQARFGDLS